MYLLHATYHGNVAEIRRLGLIARRAKGKQNTVWLLSGTIGRVLDHAMRRHGLKPHELTVFVVNVPRSWLKKGRHKGQWHTNGRDVLPDRIGYQWQLIWSGTDA